MNIKRTLQDRNHTDIHQENLKKNLKIQKIEPTPTQQKNRELLNKFIGSTLDDFIRVYFEKKFKHVKSSSESKELYAQYFSKDFIVDLANEEELNDYASHMTVCRYDIDTQERINYTFEDSCNQKGGKLLKKLLNQGYSIQFYQPQKFSEKLCLLNSIFESTFGTLAGASAYLTPPNSQALAPHHDDVEVFIIQTEGRKHWKLYNPLITLAGDHSSDLDRSEIGDPIFEIILETGDMLYLPRGTIHEAFSLDEFSTHVTLSIYQHNSWANFLEVALPKVLRRAFDNKVEFRQGLPVNYLNYMGSQFRILGYPISEESNSISFTSKVIDLIKQLPSLVTLEDLDSAADEASVDFYSHRLPPLDDVDELNLKKSPTFHKFRLSTTDHMRIIIDSDNPDMFTIYNSINNMIDSHMTGEKKNIVDDMTDEENMSGEEEDEGLSGSKILQFPLQLLEPLMIAYKAYPTFCYFDDIVSKTNIDQDLLRGMLLQLAESELITEAELQ